jgi:hypothetical protein
MTAYTIVSKDVSITGVIAQLSAIKEYPASVHIYDRVMILSNKDELWALRHGIEIGAYITEDEHEKTK